MAPFPALPPERRAVLPSIAATPAGAGRVHATEPGDIDEGFGAGQHREQRQEER